MAKVEIKMGEIGGGGGDFEINNAKHLHFATPPADGVINLGFAPQFIVWTINVSGSLRGAIWNNYTSGKWYRRSDSGSITEYSVNQTSATGALKSIDANGFTVYSGGADLDVYAVS